MKYTGEGSFENPAFPLQFTGASGWTAICHNRDELNAALDREAEQMAQGLKWALIAAAVIVPLMLWAIHG